MALRNAILYIMISEQSSLFDRRKYIDIRPQQYQLTPPGPSQTVLQTLPAYHAYLRSGDYSKYTPDDFASDVKRFGLFVRDKPVYSLQTVDMQQWIGILKRTMTDKTISRKRSALKNYFNWLLHARAIKANIAEPIPYERIISPLPDILFTNESKQLLHSASKDSRTYLLLLLLLETGLKKAEILALQPTHFDCSNQYAPELWVKHTGKQVWKDRKLKLSPEIALTFADYMEQYSPIGTLFPYTPRFIELLLAGAGQQAKLQKKITASILRDTFVVLSLQQGMKLEEVLLKIGLSDSTWEDARKKYMKLASQSI